MLKLTGDYSTGYYSITVVALEFVTRYL